MEPITIIFQTYRRTSYALATIAAARELLHYDGDLRWYVADDGSSAAHWDAVRDALGSSIEGHTVRRGYGANANAAWGAADSALTLWLEDDWEMRAPLDLTPHAYALMDNPVLGMVRLGYIDPLMREPVKDFTGRLYHTLPREWPDNAFYAFTGHPSLRHSRYRDAYGDYPEGLTPGDTELHYAYRYRTFEGPLIVWPAGYPASGVFHHIGRIKTEDLEDVVEHA
jgi:hypothetical protein